MLYKTYNIIHQCWNGIQIMFYEKINSISIEYILYDGFSVFFVRFNITKTGAYSSSFLIILGEL